MIINHKQQCNALLLRLLGSKSLANKWWKSPNKAFMRMTPIYLWKNNEQWKVINYLCAAALGRRYEP